MKNTWKALAAILVGAIFYRFIESVIPGRHHIFLKFIYMLMLLIIGFFLAPNAKRNNRWLGKVIISLVVVFIFGIQLKWFEVKEFKDILNLIGLNGGFLDLLIVYCGWAFHQV